MAKECGCEGKCQCSRNSEGGPFQSYYPNEYERENGVSVMPDPDDVTTTKPKKGE